MKSKVMLGKGIITGILTACMISGSVFGANKKLNEKVRTDGVINYEQAVELAIENNPDLRTLADSIETLQDTKSRIYTTGYVGGATGDFVMMSADRLNTVVQLNSMDTSIANSKTRTKMTKLAAEISVKSIFTTIKSTEESLELLKQQYELEKRKLVEGKTKLQLGVMSENDYTTLQNSVKTMEINIKQTELGIENAYLELNKILGFNPTDMYSIDYTVEYEPLQMETDIDTYVNKKLQTDLSLEIARQDAKSAEFAVDLFSDTGNGSDYATKENEAKTAQRTAKDAVETKKKQIRAAYLDIQKAEEKQKSLETALENAKTTLETAKVNLEVGNITETAYKEAELAVKKAEIDIQENIYSYDMKKYTFDNTCLLSDSGQ